MEAVNQLTNLVARQVRQDFWLSNDRVLEAGLVLVEIVGEVPQEADRSEGDVEILRLGAKLGRSVNCEGQAVVRCEG